MRTVAWDASDNTLRMIDQRLLPGRFEIVNLSDPYQVADAIRTMVVRGAPAIGASAAFGIALTACRSKMSCLKDLKVEISAAAEMLKASRPTAVNLSWAVQRMLNVMEHATALNPAWSVEMLRDQLITEAQCIADEDVAINRRMAAYGATLIDDGDTVIHHCNTGALATVDWGTALGVIHMASEQGKSVHVLVDETRPRLQGARLTAWELEQYGIPYEIITDNMAGYMLRTGQAQKVFFGADRVAANGDVANKIGTYMLSLAAHTNHVPVYAVVPTSTIDITLPDGDQIPIEERDPGEVLDIQINGEQVVPQGAKARNPSFDVTPHELITAIVTEQGIVYPPFAMNLPRILQGKTP